MWVQSKPSFAVALRLFASKDNYPVLVHCIHGKDRTGLIIMLLLLLCEVPAKVRLVYLPGNMQAHITPAAFAFAEAISKAFTTVYVSFLQVHSSVRHLALSKSHWTDS